MYFPRNAASYFVEALPPPTLRLHAAMANPEHLAILMRGLEEWNKWRIDHPEIKSDFTPRVPISVGEFPRAVALDGADFRKAGSNLRPLRTRPPAADSHLPLDAATLGTRLSRHSAARTV